MAISGILADNNVIGHVEYVVRKLQSDYWKEIWESLNLSLFTFEDLLLLPESVDSVVWETCQQYGVVLITANRNAAGEDSLENTIRIRNSSDHLPVITIAQVERVLHDRDYADRVVERLLEYLLDIDNLYGTGRLFVP